MVGIVAAAITMLFTTTGGVQSPQWSEKLFPHTLAPDQCENRLSRLEAHEKLAGSSTIGVVTTGFICRNMDGGDESGQARFYLPAALISGGIQNAPLIYNAGYELDENGASKLAAKGYVVCTPHAHPAHPLVRGPYLDLALLHAARGLSWVDPLRVGIQGGSAGGWMALLLTAESFPVLWSTPDVPPIHWGYNAGYLRANLDIAATPPGSTTPVMPYLYGVAQIADPSMKGLGTRFDSPSALAVSPLAHMDTITAPVQTYFSTADVLVPLNQVSHSLVKRRISANIPADYNPDMLDCYAAVHGNRTLLDVLPRRAYELFTVAVPTGLGRVPPVGKAGTGKSGTIVLPFSKRKTWSIAIVDEGAPDAECAHTKYQWGADHEPFIHWAEAQGISEDQLTAPKLERLMKRLLGEPWRKMEMKTPGSKTVTRRELMDFPAAERTDVLRGLKAFALEDGRAAHLGQLYIRLPKKLKVLGPQLGDGTSLGVRQALEPLR